MSKPQYYGWQNSRWGAIARKTNGELLSACNINLFIHIFTRILSSLRRKQLAHIHTTLVLHEQTRIAFSFGNLKSASLQMHTYMNSLFLSQNGLTNNLRASSFKKFPGGACPQTQLVLHACMLLHAYMQDRHPRKPISKKSWLRACVIT